MQTHERGSRPELLSVTWPQVGQLFFTSALLVELGSASLTDRRRGITALRPHPALMWICFHHFVQQKGTNSPRPFVLADVKAPSQPLRGACDPIPLFVSERVLCAAFPTALNGGNLCEGDASIVQRSSRLLQPLERKCRNVEGPSQRLVHPASRVQADNRPEMSFPLSLFSVECSE